MEANQRSKPQLSVIGDYGGSKSPTLTNRQRRRSNKEKNNDFVVNELATFILEHGGSSSSLKQLENGKR